MERLAIMILFATLFLAIGWNICPIEGFIPNKFLAGLAKILSFSRKSCLTHQDMSRSAILEVATEVLRETPNPNDAQSAQRLSSLDQSSLDEKSILEAYYGRCDSRRNNIFKYAVEAMQKATAGVDAGEEQHLAAAHFDSEQFESGQDRLIALRQSVVTSIKAGDYDAARTDTGRMFHTLQDFYSHTNWIENGNQAPNPVLGQPDQRIENTANSTEVTCTDCVRRGLPGTHYYECRDNIIISLIDNGILTSGYGAVQTDYNGTVIKKQPGKCSHGGLLDAKRNEPARGGINKDSPYKAISPHYYLYDEAASHAIRATASMLRDMRGDVNDDQKFGEYLGIFESRASAERTAGSRTMYSHNRNAMLQRHLNRITGRDLILSGCMSSLDSIARGFVLLID
jgi:hypothetical protein